MADSTPQRAFTVARKPLHAPTRGDEVSAQKVEEASEDSSLSSGPEKAVNDYGDSGMKREATAHNVEIVDVFKGEGKRTDTTTTASTTPYIYPRTSTLQRARTRVLATIDRLPTSRRTTLLIFLTTLLILLALSIGLGVGLHHSSSSTSDLPLPSNSDTFTGDLTYYAPGLGACGITSTDSDSIVAISEKVFDAASTSGNPNANPLCGRMLRATRFNDAVGKEVSVDLKVVDRCTGCKEDDLDTTVMVFGKMADVSLGRVQVTWAWLDE